MSGTLISIVLFIILIAASSAVIYTRLPYAIDILRIKEHYELWKERPETFSSIDVPRIIYRNGEEFITKIRIEDKGLDELHIAAEAAISPLSQEEIRSGFSSYIPEGTTLIGISEKDGYIFIDLSEEMKKADQDAYKEIESSLRQSLNFRELIVLIEGEMSEK